MPQSNLVGSSFLGCPVRMPKGFMLQSNRFVPLFTRCAEMLLLFGPVTVFLLFAGVDFSQAQGLVDPNADFQLGVHRAGGIIGTWGTSVQACSRLLGFIEGGFGALLATAAGIGALICCATGGFRSCWCLLVVSVGSFILRSYLTLFHAGCQAP